MIYLNLMIFFVLIVALFNRQFCNQFEILAWDFSRGDGLVTVRIKNRHRNQITPPQPQLVAHPPVDRQLEITPDQLVTDKVRTKKIFVKALKELLKRRQDINQCKEFYRLYGHKLVEMDFGLIELYNIRGDNMYSIQELEHIERNSKFIRWGRIFSLNALGNYNQFTEVLSCLQYYNSLVRERVFSLRTLKYYKDDVQRKKFPYSELYVMDIDDTFEFSIQNLQGNISASTTIDSVSMQMVSIEKWESQNLQNTGLLWHLRKNFFKKYYSQIPTFNNVIIPLLQFQDNPDDFSSQFFFLHLSEVNQKCECQVVIDQDCLTCSPEAFIQILYTFLKNYGFNIEQNDIYINNQRINGYKAFMEYYVQYIESVFFQDTQSKAEIMKKIFEDIPIQLLTLPYNYPLDERFIIPNNFTEIANLLQK